MKASVSVLTILFLSLSFGVQAHQCHTPRFEVEFELVGDRIVFYTEEAQTRQVAQAGSVGTMFEKGEGLTQIFDFNEQKHVIHLHDRSQPDSARDYYLVTNRKGETMLYPLHCSGKKALVSLR
jgi:hypothetical protein